jgi:hypothetical protein
MPATADRGCLELLDLARVPYRPVGAVRGVRTPVEVIAPVGGVRLVPRAGRPAVMDCRLALTLAELVPVFRRYGVTGLSFSGAYDYRTRRGSSKLSAHAFGLAIDVHMIVTRAGVLDVKRDYPKDGDRWHGTAGRPDSVAACLGRPARANGRALRSLACRLKLDPLLRHVLSPDTDSDHHDHLHIETWPARDSDLLTSRGRPAQQARKPARSRR